ncbi:MAG: response regulator, partial [Campylobacterota bacterium]|nr:response regulator [Campylobacterota bacterium]
MKLNTAELKKITILYVEDDEVVRLQTKTVFEKLFKKVYIGYDGENGLEIYKLNKSDIDIVITDINMPNMDGLTMIKKINNIHNSIPTIVTTAHTDSKHLLNAIDRNVDKYITKPIQIKELTVAIFELVAKYKRAENIESLAKNLALKTTKDDKQNIELNNMIDIVRNQNIHLKTVIENLVVKFETDKNGIITEVTNKFTRFFGYNKNDIIGKDINILKSSSCEQESFQKMMLKAIHTKKTVVSSYTFETKEKKPFDAEVTMTPKYSEDALVSGYTFYLDIL